MKITLPFKLTKFLYHGAKMNISNSIDNIIIKFPILSNEISYPKKGLYELYLSKLKKI